ncbi:hypothetical protein ACTXT7_013019 [Hymenolepis weldensis]
MAASSLLVLLTAEINCEDNTEAKVDHTQVNDMPKQEVKLTKQDKRARRRQQRDVKEEQLEEGAVSEGNPDPSLLKGNPIEPVDHSNSKTEIKQVPKAKAAKPKKPRRRRQRVAGSEVAEQTVNPEIQEDEEEQEVTIIGFSSNIRSQQVSSPQAVSSQLHLCMICNEVFPSKNKLFSHIKETGHAALKSTSTVISQKPNKNKKNRRL